jgi:hypothetical protein
MTSLDGNDLFAKFHGRAPVGAAEIERFHAETGVDLPRDYVAFLRQSDGGEGFIGPNAYVIFWQLRELAEFNKAYQVEEYVPGLLIFGSNGGGEAYAFDTLASAMPIVSVPFVGMEPSLVCVLAATFSDLLKVLSSLND